MIIAFRPSCPICNRQQYFFAEKDVFLCVSSSSPNLYHKNDKFLRLEMSKDQTTPEKRSSEQKLLEILQADLPLQYVRPVDLSIYARNVRFKDPVTDITGKLNYWGMLTSLRVIARVFCNEGKGAKFYLDDIQMTKKSGETKVKTIWRTTLEFFWGSSVFISGVDFFYLNSDGLIAFHESFWDQEPSSVFKDLQKKKT